MRLIFFVVALLVGTTAALEKDHLEKLKIATSELKLADHFEAEGINPANLDRVRRGFDPQCYNAELRAVQKCSFSIVDIIRTLTLNVDAEVNNVLCSNDSCYNAVLNYSQTCKFQSFARSLEEKGKFDCIVNPNGTYCFEASLAVSDNTSRMCFQSIATCRSDKVCNEHFKDLIKQYGCCMKELIDRRFPFIPGNDFFEFCGLPNPGNCPSTNVSVNSTTSTVHPVTHCRNKAREFANIRGCSAGVDLRPQSSQVFFPQPRSSCERQLFLSRFCRSQKCLNSYVDLLEECLNASGLENIIQNDTEFRNELLDQVITLNSKLYCAKDPERKDFCGVMFPEFSNPMGPSPLFNLTCAIQEGTGSCSSDQECVDTVNSAVDHYGCCLTSFLKFWLKVDPKKFYERCGVKPPDPCRTKLKDPRKN